jgi:hypothetical protein
VSPKRYQLTRYDERGWRATFYTTGTERSPTSAARTSSARYGGSMKRFGKGIVFEVITSQPGINNSVTFTPGKNDIRVVVIIDPAPGGSAVVGLPNNAGLNVTTSTVFTFDLV